MAFYRCEIKGLLTYWLTYIHGRRRLLELPL